MELTTHKRRFHLIAITGGFGSGKSTVASFLREKYPVISSDEISRSIIESDVEIQRSLRDQFGTGIFEKSGDLNRTKLADIVFSNPGRLKKLNEIIHPETIRRILEISTSLADEGNSIIFVESALVFEAHIDSLFDYIITVFASEARIIQRVVERGLFSEADIRGRMKRQLRSEGKANRSDFTLRNDGSLEELKNSTAIIVNVVAALCR